MYTLLGTPSIKIQNKSNINPVSKELKIYCLGKIEQGGIQWGISEGFRDYVSFEVGLEG